MTGSAARIVTNISAGIDDPSRFGNRLRMARTEKGWSQLELAAATGYSNGWISGVERGTSVPTLTFARRMELALGTDLGVSSITAMSLGKRSGSVGDWGMTATEVAGYCGLSRTRIYQLMRNYVKERESYLSVVDWKTEIPWKEVDGYRRIIIEDCARWVVEDKLRSGDIDISNRPDSAGFDNSDSSYINELVASEAGKIREWLKTRRSSL